MNKKDEKIRRSERKIKKDSSYNEEYSYDFVPTLEQWVNVDEQRKIVKRLEDIEK